MIAVSIVGLIASLPWILIAAAIFELTQLGTANLVGLYEDIGIKEPLERLGDRFTN